MSYAVAWRSGDGRQYAGRLDLGADALRLDGAGVIEELPYECLAEVRIARNPGERLAGAPTLVVREHGGRTVRLACIGGPGALPELVERLSRSRATALRARS